MTGAKALNQLAMSPRPVAQIYPDSEGPCAAIHRHWPRSHHLPKVKC